MSGGFFKGTSMDQDSRFPDKQKKLLAKMQFPVEYDQKVNLMNVRIDLLRSWISSRITSILGEDDDVVVDLVVNSLDAAQKAVRAGKKEGLLDPRELQINLTGFLEKQARPFVLELWNLLLSAGQAPNGIPPQLLEAKKNEILAAKNAAVEQAKIAAALRAGIALPPSATQPVKTEPGKRVSRFGPSPSVSTRDRGQRTRERAPFCSISTTRPLAPPRTHEYLLLMI
jgi:hypothetical protein